MLIPKTYFKQFKTKKYSSSGPTNYIKKKLISNFINNIEKIVSVLKPKTIAELGCGEGFVSIWLKSRYPNTEFTAVDIDKKDLELLKEHSSHIKTIQLDLEKLNNSSLIKEKFDLILCLETIEHLNNPEFFLNHLKKINCLNIIISAPWEPFFQISNFLRGQNIKNWGNDPGHINRWNNKKLKNLLSKNFNIKKNKICFHWQIFWLENKLNKDEN